MPVACSTIRKTDTAKGPPKERGRFVTRIKIGPRRERVYSLAASEAEVEAAGYSPPVPKPMMPREMVSIHTVGG